MSMWATARSQEVGSPYTRSLGTSGEYDGTRMRWYGGDR